MYPAHDVSIPRSVGFLFIDDDRALISIEPYLAEIYPDTVLCQCSWFRRLAQACDTAWS